MVLRIYSFFCIFNTIIILFSDSFPELHGLHWVIIPLLYVLNGELGESRDVVAKKVVALLSEFE